jgi:hypothetical protein
MPPNPDCTATSWSPEVRALREEIRRRGSQFGGAVLGAYCLSCVLGIMLCTHLAVTVPGASWLGSVGMVVGIVSTVLLAGGRLATHVRRLRAELAGLSDAERLQVLQSLREEQDAGTRLMVAPLLRELHVGSTELTPAPTPSARGDEPTPVD